MKNWNKKVIIVLSIVLATASLAACGDSSAANNSAANAQTTSDAQTTEVTTYTEYEGLQTYAEFAGVEALPDNADAEVIRIAYGYSGYPIAYTTNTGTASGYDIEMLKAVDSLLPQYTFEFVPQQGGEDLLLSVQTGKTTGAVRNWFQTPERREIFTFPENNIGLSVTGITVRKEDIDTIYDFGSLYAAGGNLAPVDPGDGHYTVLKNWCDANAPDWDFETGQVANSADKYNWVAEGRYDASFGLEVSFNSMVLAEDGSAHQHADELTWTACAAVPTYVIFNGNEDGKAIGAAFDSVIDEIWESGYADYLQETLYGVDYIAIYGRNGVGVLEDQ